ncbi:MAG: GrpB family protein [Pseudomonadota bacterium]
MTENESLLAAINEDVALHPYDGDWPVIFGAERDRLTVLFPHRFLGIEHIGSTAIPGLLAKPIIDILAGVESMIIAKSLAEHLCRSSYTTSDEFNQSLSDRQWFMRWANGHRTHHLHLVVYNSATWNEHVVFRDALCANAGLAAKYAALKLRLAAAHSTDREAYSEAKQDFVRAVIEGIKPVTQSFL